MYEPPGSESKGGDTWRSLWNSCMMSKRIQLFEHYFQPLVQKATCVYGLGNTAIQLCNPDCQCQYPLK